MNPFQVHTHQATIKLAYRANFDSMCLVTDAIGALGLKDGVYTLGQQQIQARGFELLKFFIIANAIPQLLLYFHVTGDRAASFCGGDSHIGRSHWKHVVWREKLIPLVRMQPRSRTTSSLTSPSSSFGNPRQKRLQTAYPI